MSVDNPHSPVAPDVGAAADRRGNRTDFWFISVARGTALVYASLLVFLSIVFIKADLAAAELSLGLLLRNIASAAFWSLLGVFGTCYYTIPIATLVVAAVRSLLRRRRRRVEAPLATATGGRS